MTDCPTPPRAIIFDWDNTLVDSWGTIHAALDETFRSMGQVPWTLDECRVRVRASLRDSFPGLFRERWQEAAEVFYRAYEKLHLERLTPLPGAGEMLAALAESGIWLGVVSNKRGLLLRREVEHLGWGRYFQRLVGAGDARRDKPARDPVDMALDGSGIAPCRDVWFVGDAGIDMEIAHCCGCVPVLLRSDAAPLGEFDRHPPALRLGSCTELITRMRGL